VLLVEDEAAVRRLTRGILRSAGYQVLEASNGVEALELAAAHPGPIHALLSDVVMPRMGGYELAQRLAETRPELRTLFVSGYPGDSLPPSPPGAQLVLIAKPFREEELLEQLRAVLS